jgi:hypothetical protein
MRPCGGKGAQVERTMLLGKDMQRMGGARICWERERRKEEVIPKVDDLMELYWRWLLCSPAKCHEYSMFELSRVWEPSNSLEPLPYGKGEATQIGFLDGNQTTCIHV